MACFVFPQKRKHGVHEGTAQHPQARSGGNACAYLAAAREVLAKEGEQRFNLAQVARRAGVNRGTPYAHFQTREQLIAAASAGMSDELCEKVFSGTPTIDRVIHRFARCIAENPELGWVWLLRLLNSKQPAQDSFFRLYLAHFEEFAKTEYAQHIDAQVLAVTTLAGTLMWPLWMGARCNIRETRRQMAQRFAREVLRLSLRGAQRRATPEVR